MEVKLPSRAGARPPKKKMMFLPKVSSWRRFPLRKPSPTPANSNSDPTPQAMPNMVRNERSLCAHRVRNVWPKVSRSMRIGQLKPSGGIHPAVISSTGERGERLADVGESKFNNAQCNRPRKFESVPVLGGVRLRALRSSSLSLFPIGFSPCGQAASEEIRFGNLALAILCDRNSFDVHKL